MSHRVLSHQHFVFDLDGTLVDSFPSFFVIMEQIFNEYGSSFPADQKLTALTIPLADFFAIHLGQHQVESAMKKLQVLSNEDAKTVRPFPGVIETLVALKKQNAEIGIWTNRDFTSADLILKHSGIAPHASILVSGTCTIQRKPHHEGLERVIEHFGVHPSQVTMVGDHHYDVLAGKTVGARSIRASWQPHWKMDPCTDSDFQFYDFEEFRKFLKV